MKIDGLNLGFYLFKYKRGLSRSLDLARKYFRAWPCYRLDQSYRTKVPVLTSVISRKKRTIQYIHISSWKYSRKLYTNVRNLIAIRESVVVEQNLG